MEVGTGYTTPFLARALAEIEEMVPGEAAALATKCEPYLREGREFDDAWLRDDPALLTPSYYQKPYRPHLVAVDDLSMPDSSAGRVQAVLAELGLDDRVTLVNAQLRDCADQLPEGFTPIDFTWIDTWDCLYFFENMWHLVNPDGGLVLMHYLMTYPEGEAILEYITQTQALRPGEFEVLNLLESQKLRQNSLTILRRTSDVRPRWYGYPGHRARMDGEVRADAVRLVESVAAHRGG
jgi:hypothetical protein